MNIFVLDSDVKKAAQAHADKHVVKMLLEACQLLYTAHWFFAYPQLEQYKAAIQLSIAQKKLSIPQSMISAPPSLTRPDEQGFRPVHIHHPCAKWVRESIENYRFCSLLAIELSNEFSYRYPKKGAHECEHHAHWLLSNPPPGIPNTNQTSFVLAMDDIFKTDDPIESYRNYYQVSKRERGLLQYKVRPPPDWL
jgi:hypothetical protein